MRSVFMYGVPDAIFGRVLQTGARLDEDSWPLA